MSYQIPDNKILLLVLAPAAALLTILLLFEQSFTFSLLFILIYCVFAIAFINNKVGLYLLIFFRPCLDYFTDKTVSLSGFSFNFAGLFAILAIVFAAVVVFKNFDQLDKAPLGGTWFIFILAMIFSLPSSVNIADGITEITRFLSIILVFYAAITLIRDKRDLANLIKIVIVSAIIPSCMAVWQYFTKTGLTIPFEGVYNRVYGTFAHPNLLAFYLLLALTLCFVVFLVSDKKQVSIITYGLLAMLFLTTLAFTYTRSAWIGLVIIIFMLGITRYRTFLVVSLIVLALGYFSIEQVNARFSSFTLKDPSSSIQWRIDLWKDGWKLASERPITGYGAGTAKEVILKERGPEAGSSDPHNDYLRMALETGFIGLTVFLLFILALLKKLFRVYNGQTQPKLKTLSFVVLMLTGGFFLIALGDNILANTALQWSLWAVLGGIFSTQKELLS